MFGLIVRFICFSNFDIRIYMGLAMEKIKLYVENAWVAPSNLFGGVKNALF